ncbi:MAG: hypothetical protein Q9M89_01500 [Persephonella sp.]|nr:hypothetical protein [Persephonella sp.]
MNSYTSPSLKERFSHDFFAKKTFIHRDIKSFPSTLEKLTVPENQTFHKERKDKSVSQNIPENVNTDTVKSQLGCRIYIKIRFR